MNNEFYEKDGKRYERVTRILDYFSPPELVDWRVRVGKKEANRVSKIALKFGSRVHELIETTKCAADKDAEEIKNCMKAWESWKDDHLTSNEILENGETLFDEVRGIAGTPDLIIRNQHNTDLIDFKTSREVKAIHFIQLGGYASMLRDMPERLAIIRLDKSSGIYEYVKNENIGMTVEQCISAFNYLLGYYRFYQNVQSTLKPNRAMPEGEIE